MNVGSLIAMLYNKTKKENIQYMLFSDKLQIYNLITNRFLKLIIMIFKILSVFLLLFYLHLFFYYSFYAYIK